MKKLVRVFLIVLMFIGFSTFSLDANNKDISYEWFKVYSFPKWVYPYDLLVDSENNKILIPLDIGVSVSIMGPRILVLNYKGEVEDCIWYKYSWEDSKKIGKKFNFYYLFKEKDGYLVIGGINSAKYSAVSFERIVFLMLDKDLKKIKWIKGYSLLASIIFSAVKFQDSYYLTLYDFGCDFRKTNEADAVLLKVDKNGNILNSKRLAGLNYYYRPYFLAGENNLFLISYLEVLSPQKSSIELLIGEINPDNLDFKWKKTIASISVVANSFAYINKEIIVFANEPAEILRFDLKGNLLQEVKYQFKNTRWFYPQFIFFDKEKNEYYVFGDTDWNHAVLKLDKNFNPIKFQNLGPSSTAWPEGLLEGVIRDQYNKWIITYGWATPTPLTEFALMRLDENLTVPNNSIDWLSNFPLPDKELIELDKSKLKETDSFKRITLTDIKFSPALIEEIEGIKEAPEKKDIKLKMNYIAKYRITAFVTPSNTGRIEPNDVLIQAGKSQDFKIIPEEGYEIEDVFLNGVSLGPKDNFTVTPTKDTTVVAQLKRKIFTIEIVYEPKESGVGGILELPYGSSVDIYITPTPGTGYIVKDVIVDGKSVGPVKLYNFSNIKDNHALKIICEKKKIVIIAKTNEGGNISPQGEIEVEYGTSQTFTIISKIGYQIRDVLVDGKSIGPVSTYTFENLIENHTIEVIFEPISFTITATSGFGGFINPSGKVNVNYGESKTFIITPEKGYKIKEVIVDGKSIGVVSSYTFRNVTENHTISVIFEKEIKIILQIGSKKIYINNSPQEIDVAPTIVEGRTYIPIRYIVEPLGGETLWDSQEKKIKIVFKDRMIELWIGKNISKVDGEFKLIDPGNPKVVPMIISGRTMLPLRFVAENLGCKVDWDDATKTITIIYPKD